MSLAARIVILLIGLSLADAEAGPRYVMPRELVEHAHALGCSQVEDFFDTPGMIGPPYTYGYQPGPAEDSAAFWCEKMKDGKRQFFLALMVRPGIAEGALACPRLIPWPNYPGGLAVYRDPHESLEAYAYLDAPGQKGPRGKAVTHSAIQSSKPGQSTTFYCHEGRWLARSKH